MMKAVSSLGLPPLPSSDGLPRSADRLLLLFILGEKGRSRSVELSQRHLTKWFGRKDNSRIAARLSLLVKSGFLARVGHSKSGKRVEGDAGYCYARGARLARGSGLEKRATKLALIVFGSKGFCSGLINRPGFSFGYLNPSGCVVFGVLRAAGVPLSVRDLRLYLKPLLSVATTSVAIKRLVENGLVVVEGDQVALADSWVEKLLEYELSSGASKSADARDARFDRDRDSRSHSKGQPALKDRKVITTWSCVVCGKPGKKFEMEHFPAKVFLKRIGGLSIPETAHWAFVFPACVPCHKRMTKWVSAHRGDAFPKIKVRSSTVARSDTELRSDLRMRMLFYARLFCRSVREGDDAAARLAIVKALNVWQGYVSRYPKLRPVGGTVTREDFASWMTSQQR
jgi:5-methylcytosine-specific restriction endonuclease McrA